MRFTGEPLGRPRRGGVRETATQKVCFFSDSDQTTTIRWYAVPADRPVMPVSSFVANEVWHNDNWLGFGMLYGHPPGVQGVQWGGPDYEKKDPVDHYNPAHYCGTPAQWAGALSLASPSDRGAITCCGPIIPPNPGVFIIALTPAAGYSFGLEDAGRLGVSLTPAAAYVYSPDVAGLLSVLLTPAAAYVYSPDVAGLLSVLLTPAAGYVYWPTEVGRLSLSLTPAAGFTFGLSEAGRLSLLLAPNAGAYAIGMLEAGSLGMVLTAKGAFAFGLTEAGKLGLSLTPKATFAFSPAVSPGTTCATAGTLTLGVASGPHTYVAGHNDWYTWPVVSGTTYYCKVTVSGAGGMDTASVSEGSCPSPGNKFSLSLNTTGGHCNTFVAGASDSGFCLINGAAGITYTIQVGAGSCPP